MYPLSSSLSLRPPRKFCYVFPVVRVVEVKRRGHKVEEAEGREENGGRLKTGEWGGDNGENRRGKK